MAFDEDLDGAREHLSLASTLTVSTWSSTLVPLAGVTRPLILVGGDDDEIEEDSQEDDMIEEDP